jgi:nicotinamide riboside kinase
VSAPVVTIAVVGAECTGKTSLCRALAQARGGLWVPEYLREFVDTEHRPPMPQEQAFVIDEQIARETAALQAATQAGHPLVALDSTPLATALYSSLYYNDDSLLAPAVERQRSYDVTLVTGTDLPWEPDGVQRDGPQIRAQFHALLLDLLQRQQLPFTLVQGQDDARLAAALSALD